MEEYLNQLNESQRQAVLYNDGPALVIAGAGSGKTRVLTYKIAYLISQGVQPWQILALTFTNKAAREMKERIASIVGAETASRLWMGTFHSVFARILRREAASVGYPSNFTIYDATDSKNLIKSIVKEMQLDEKTYRIGTLQNRISQAKNALVTAKAYQQNGELAEADRQARIPLAGEIYARYQSRLWLAEAMDFDDLLLQTNILLRDHPEVLAKYRQQFRHVLVDEYQDTNFAQHLIVQRLCEKNAHICVVGDDAQSIYSFRGANIDNILQFRDIYPDCRTFKLERNYRSTQNIVNAANSLIHKNKEQIFKNVYSEKEPGSRVGVLSSYTDYQEAFAVAARVTAMHEAGYRFADCAILYRTNAQSRILEEALRKQLIPYRVYGGLSFYQRKEVKDAIAYFRLSTNPHDEEAFKRVLNYPVRGIGNLTLGKLQSASHLHGVSLWRVLSEPAAYDVVLPTRTAARLEAFRAMIEAFGEAAGQLSAFELAERIVKESGIVADLFQDRTPEGIGKQENLRELLKGIAEFCDIRREEGAGNVSMADFLAEVSLLTDQDADRDGSSDKVTLMTIHAAKGLEFKNVFIVGVEEDLFPSSMVKNDPRGIEEERRLFYVALTRAEEHCLISYAKSRYRNGTASVSSPSRFLRDIDPQYLEDLSDTPASFFAKRDSAAAGARPAAPQTDRDSLTVADLARMKLFVPESAPHPVHLGLGDADPNPAFGCLEVGCRVSHERFGQGRVVALVGEGNDVKATVDFETFGRKQLLLKFARLKRQ